MSTRYNTIKHLNILRRPFGEVSQLEFKCRGCTIRKRDGMWHRFCSSIDSELDRSIDNSYMTLEEEPDNEYDPNAIMVVCRGEFFGIMGYVGREFTGEVKRVLADCDKYRVDMMDENDAGQKEITLILSWTTKGTEGSDDEGSGKDPAEPEQDPDTGLSKTEVTTETDSGAQKKEEPKEKPDDGEGDQMTIKQIADELGVSKTAIRNHLTPEFRAAYAETDCKGVIRITPEGLRILTEKLAKNQKQEPETTANQAVFDEVTFLRSQLQVKDRQIEELQRQNSQLTAALQSAQAIQVGQMRLLTDGSTSHRWWQFWK